MNKKNSSIEYHSYLLYQNYQVKILRLSKPCCCLKVKFFLRTFANCNSDRTNPFLFQRHVLTFAEREEAEAENGIISRRGDAFRERAGPLFRGGATRRSLGGSERVAEDQDADEIRFMAFGRL